MSFLEQRAGKILEVIKEQIVAYSQPLDSFDMADLPPHARYGLPPEDAIWQLYSLGLWQGDDSYAWFRCELRLSPEMAGLPVYLCVETGRSGWDALNPQFTLYVDGELRQGMDVNHRDLLLTSSARGDEVYNLLMQGYSGDSQEPVALRLSLEARHPEVSALYHDLRVPLEAAQLMQPEDGSYITIMGALNAAINLLDLRQLNSTAFHASVQAARAYLKEHLYSLEAAPDSPCIHCVGHTHIDVAWLWPLRVTEDKALRSFATVIQYMQEYPEYLFMSSQPQLYAYVEALSPALFARIREAQRLGRWEAEGAMYVEADCNLSGGEALVRQILHGKRYFKEKFGVDNRLLWLPDVFGYSAALPQILRKSGIDYFMTTKISWNERNRFPYDSFLWEGIDGSRVLSHFSPSRDYNLQPPARSNENRHYTTYNAVLGAKQLMGAWQRYQQKDLSTIALMSFGHGDGGGGPTRDMLEAYTRLHKGLPGVPKAQMNHSLPFFEALEQQVKDDPALPCWVGEIYLEYHRGTYTSMARNKRLNRQSEYALINNELYSLMANELMNQPYPAQRLLKGWEVLERNQFHDILPGSSIKEVYEDSLKEYEALGRENGDICQQALNALSEGAACEAGDILVYNPNSHAFDAAVAFPLPEGAELPQVWDGERALPTQRDAQGTGRFSMGAVPAKGYKSFRLSGKAAEGSTAAISGRRFETWRYVIDFDEQMQIASLYDKLAGRQLIREGAQGNRLMSYEDRPHRYDAWDVNDYYSQHNWPIEGLDSWQVEENGPVRCVIAIRRSYLSSTIEQRIILYARDSRIDFENLWDWKESHILVKALFPVDVHANEATYEIQFGHVKRPTHFNTSWDQARFEVCHHKWLDLSEEGYGVSLINNCKYGADVHFGVIGLTLLKSATWPNPDADRELHRFTYALLPHVGSWQEAGVLQAAYALNNPALAMVKQGQGGSLPPAMSFVSSSEPNVVIEAVKQAEDGEACVVRLYEAYGRRTSAQLRFHLDIAQARLCSLMEEDEEALAFEGNLVEIDMKPFEIKSLKIRFAEPGNKE